VLPAKAAGYPGVNGLLMRCPITGIHIRDRLAAVKEFNNQEITGQLNSPADPMYEGDRRARHHQAKHKNAHLTE